MTHSPTPKWQTGQALKRLAEAKSSLSLDVQDERNPLSVEKTLARQDLILPQHVRILQAAMEAYLQVGGAWVSSGLTCSDLPSDALYSAFDKLFNKLRQWVPMAGAQLSDATGLDVSTRCISQFLIVAQGSIRTCSPSGPTMAVISGSQAEWEQLLSAAETSATKQFPDGPFGDDGFRYNGKVYRGLTQKPFRAVKYIWHRPEQRAALSELAGPVLDYHGDEPESKVKKSRANGWRGRANEFFVDNRIPWELKLRSPKDDEPFLAFYSSPCTTI